MASRASLAIGWSPATQMTAQVSSSRCVFVIDALGRWIAARSDRRWRRLFLATIRKGRAGPALPRDRGAVDDFADRAPTRHASEHQLAAAQSTCSLSKPASSQALVMTLFEGLLLHQARCEVAEGGSFVPMTRSISAKLGYLGAERRDVAVRTDQVKVAVIGPSRPTTPREARGVLPLARSSRRSRTASLRRTACR